MSLYEGFGLHLPHLYQTHLLGKHTHVLLQQLLLHPPVDTLKHFQQLVENLDLIIAVDTAVAHLAGALGKPVWLLNRHESEWRWMQDRDDSPWYPTMTIFRQSAPGKWDDVFSNVYDRLKLLTFSEHS